MTSSVNRPPEVLAAMQRTREAAQQLERDALTVACWLDANFPGLIISIELQRHHSCEDDQLAHVEPRVTDRQRRHEVRDHAEAALKALGWTIQPEGRGVRSSFYRPSASISAHGRLAAVKRVQDAIDAAGFVELSRPLMKISGD